MKEEKIIFALFGVAMIIMTLVSIKFAIATFDLYKFKSCYDINFQDDKCQKYLDY